MYCIHRQEVGPIDEFSPTDWCLQAGIQEECFIFREKDLISFAGASQMMGAFEYIQTRWEGTYADTYGSGAESLISRGLQLNDFFSNEYNNMKNGLLVTEFVPPEFKDMPRNMPDFSKMDAMGMRTDQVEQFGKDLDDMPCVKISDIESKLPECLREKDDPIPLEKDHCQDAYLKALEDVDAYSERIEAVPLKSTRYRWVVHVCVSVFGMCASSCTRD